MEVERVFYLQPTSTEGKKEEEEAAVLLHLVGVQYEKLKQPTSLAELVLMGIELRRKGS